MMARHDRLPLPGQRIARSVVAVWLCFGLYFLRGRHGMPFYSVIAALQCIQPDAREMYSAARKRIVGTLIGAFWGLLVLLLETELIHEGVPDELPHYLLMGLAVGVVIYSTVLLRLREMAYFSAVVFLSVAVNHIGDANPYLYAFNRLLDTVLGVLMAELVNRCHLPRVRHTDVLFVSGVEDTILGADRKLSPYSKVELNRLIEDGAKFTISTVHSQATVRELLAGVELPYPIITMDGAALYDMKTMGYLKTRPMTEEQARRIIDWTREQELPYLSISIQDDLLVVHYRELANDAMRQIVARKHHSPYRNFVHVQEDSFRQLLYLQIVDSESRVEEAWADLTAQPWAGDYRAVRTASATEGYAMLKIFQAGVCREAMLKELEALMGTRETVSFGSVPGKFDVSIRDADRDQMVKELKRRFEPVDLRGWKNMFRI